MNIMKSEKLVKKLFFFRPKKKSEKLVIDSVLKWSLLKT